MSAATRIRLLMTLAGVMMAGCLMGCSPSTSQPAAAPASSASPNAQAGPSAASSADPSTASGGPADGQCRLGDLSAVREDSKGYVPGMNQMLVVWTNHSGHVCTMTGFAGVDLVDAGGQRYSAPRAKATPKPVSLSPGGRAHTLISYAASGGTSVFRPTTIQATPPNETHSASVPWPPGIGVPLFDAPSATELSVGPIEPNAS